MIYVDSYQSPLGKITLAGTEQTLIGLWFEKQAFFADTLPESHEEKETSLFQDSKRWLDMYFSGKVPDFTPPLQLQTTPFRKAVWEIVLSIPYGETMTYGDIACKIASQRGIARMSAQAVGNAVGKNSISLIIPCHRVVGQNGNLTGYAGGIDRKLSLLALEKVDLSRFYVPKSP